MSSKWPQQCSLWKRTLQTSNTFQANRRKKGVFDTKKDTFLVLMHVNTSPHILSDTRWQMRRCGRIPYDSFALVSNGWNEWLTSFVWVVGAVGLTITEPGLGNTGLLVVAVKLPYVAQDGFWMAWRKGGERDRKDAAWGDDREQVAWMFHQKKHEHLNMSVSGEEEALLGLSLEPHAVNGTSEEALTYRKWLLYFHQWKHDAEWNS